jgi:hypothetical protein
MEDGSAQIKVEIAVMPRNRHFKLAAAPVMQPDSEIVTMANIQTWHAINGLDPVVAWNRVCIPGSKYSPLSDTMVI